MLPNGSRDRHSATCTDPLAQLTPLCCSYTRSPLCWRLDPMPPLQGRRLSLRRGNFDEKCRAIEVTRAVCSPCAHRKVASEAQLTPLCYSYTRSPLRWRLDPMPPLRGCHSSLRLGNFDEKCRAIEVTRVVCGPCAHRKVASQAQLTPSCCSYTRSPLRWRLDPMPPLRCCRSSLRRGNFDEKCRAIEVTRVVCGLCAHRKVASQARLTPSCCSYTRSPLRCRLDPMPPLRGARPG